MFPDPQGPLKARAPTAIDLKLSKEELNNTEIGHMFQMALVTAMLFSGEKLDKASGSNEWRLDVYKSVAAIMMNSTHEGTGSSFELATHRALEALSVALDVSAA